MSHKALRSARKGRLQAQIAALADDGLRFCPIPGCGRPTQARAGNGFSLTHCRYHVQARNRFGSFWKRNIPASILDPFGLATNRFLKSHADHPDVVAALHALQSLMDGAGRDHRIVDVNRLLSPRDKARASLARLREAEVDPKRLLAAYLAVAAAIEEDPIKPGGEPSEYLRVQAAKRIWRMKSGEHSVYGPGVRWSRWPRSAGRSLRHLGEMIEEACDHVLNRHLDAILQLKHEGDRKHAA